MWRLQLQSKDTSQILRRFKKTYLLKPETSQNDRKPAKTTQSNCKVTRNSPKFWDWWGLEFSISFHFSNFESKRLILGILGQMGFLMLRNFACTLFRRYWLNEISHVPYFESADFKTAICFWKFWAQIPKYDHFKAKSTNFLVFTKFCMCTFSKVVISNLSFVFENFEPKSKNLDVLYQKVLTFNLNEILHLISKVFLLYLAFVFKNFEPKSQNLSIFGQKVSSF